MPSTLTKESLSKSLKVFKSRRDALLHDDTDVFRHNLAQFTQFIQSDALAQQVIQAISSEDVNTKEWWDELAKPGGKVHFPHDRDCTEFCVSDLSSEYIRRSPHGPQEKSTQSCR